MDKVFETAAVVIPAAPAGLGYADSAALPDVPAFADYAHTKQRDNPCMVGVTLAAASGCTAVTAAARTTA